MIAPTAIIAGLGMSLEMDIVEVEGATGDYHTNLINKAGFIIIYIYQFIDSFIENINKDYDFGFLHVKAVDDCGHDKNID